MRHPHHMPPPLPNPIEIERAIRHLEAQIRAKHADTLADRISGMSKPGELEYTDPAHDPWSPSWPQTFAIGIISFFGTLGLCALGTMAWLRWGHAVLELIKTAPWPRLG